MRFYIAWTLAGLAVSAASADAQIVQRNAEYWLPADYNYQFYDQHREAARSFYAAHYAHFVVYEEGLAGQVGLDARLTEAEAEIRRLIEEPPKFEPPIDVIAPDWARMAHQTASAMDWTHHLHEQLYDILSDDRVVDRKAAGEAAISHYLGRADAAFSTRGYGHAFMMGGGEWAGSFAERYPSINGILWAYHWHHAAVYEALMEETHEERARELNRVLTVFVDSVLVDPPTYMPVTAQVAPRFGAMFPAAAHIFDNLHMMHDVVNDIMVSAMVPTSSKAEEIARLLAQQLYRGQRWVLPPAISHEDMMEEMPGMPMQAMTVPTELPDGSWLPQGHPDAALPEGMGGMKHDGHGDDAGPGGSR